MNILADASLPGLKAAFPAPFNLTLYEKPDEIPLLIEQQDVLLCRANLKVDENHLPESSLRYVATASSGIDHIDSFFLKKQGIKLLDAKGCNASSVADYLMSCLAFLDTQHLIKGKKAGIIGMGAVGSTVYHRLRALDFQIKTYDPPKALIDTHFKSCTLDDLLDCDLLCIHAALHNKPPYPSIHLLNSVFLEQLKPGCLIINAARGGIIDETALLQTTKPLIYCTDVYANEPAIEKKIVDKALLCTPHIAGHSLEAKFRAVEMISRQLHEILHLKMPEFLKPSFVNQQVHQKFNNWQELTLSIYNPIDETCSLKKAGNNEQAFQALRKQHQTRHDFFLYHQFSDYILI